MMTSPEEFYKVRLQGKNEQQVLSVIEGIRQRMEWLKMQIEDPRRAYGEGEENLGKRRQLVMEREYLALAKRALADCGGKYVPSKAELKAAAFDRRLQHICRAEFSSEYLFRDRFLRVITVDPVTGEIAYKELIGMAYCEISIEDGCPRSREELIGRLQALHLGEWRRAYFPEQYGMSVLDGEQWELRFAFANSKRSVIFEGSNVYPFNFDEVRQLFGKRY